MTEPLDLSETAGGLKSALPFLGIAATFVAHAVSIRIHQSLGAPVYLHPLLFAILGVAGCLYLWEVPYHDYFRSAEPLHLLLGPVVVLLAVPLWRHMRDIREIGPKLIPALLIGALVGIASSAGLVWLFDGSPGLAATLAPKSVTTPIAISLSEGLGGVPAITALVVILTGLVGATTGYPILCALRIKDARVQGLAIGLSSHAIGTARAFQINATIGAYSGLGMILNALITVGLIGVFRLMI